MSAQTERDHQQELADGAAGDRGLAVDARCTSCKRVRAKRVPGRDPDETETAFRHVCHRCKCVTYWNILRVLEGSGE